MPQDTPRLNVLLREVQNVCGMGRGRKAALSRYLSVRPSQLNEWLTNHRCHPSAEYVLGMAEWLREQQPAMK